MKYASPFFTLLDENSDYVWSYNGCYVILRLACMALPWGESYCIEPQHFDDDLDIPDEFVDLMQHQKTELTIKQAEEVMYKRQIPSPFEYAEGEFVSAAQMAFITSGIIPPRYNNVLSFVKSLVQESELIKEVAVPVMEYISLAYSLGQREKDYRVYDDLDLPWKALPEPETDVQAVEQTLKLKAENKRLKDIAHGFEQRSKAAAEQLSKAERELKEGRQSLRSCVP